jgi:hypothetical protein
MVTILTTNQIWNVVVKNRLWRPRVRITDTLSLSTKCTWAKKTARLLRKSWKKRTTMNDHIIII